MADKSVLLEKLDGVAIITLNRPERLNAQNQALKTELEQAITDCETDDNTRAIIITGSGDKSFSSGADIHEMAELSKSGQKERDSFNLEWTWHIATCKKPTIAAVNGLAYGGGALLASLADIRLGCERTSFKFLGATYGRVNSTWTLPYIVGLPVAKELMFTGRLVTADEALRIGLINKLFTSADLMKGAIEMGQAIAANNAQAVQGIKDILNRNIGLSWREMMLNEVSTVSQTMKVPAPKDSFKDFLERNQE